MNIFLEDSNWIKKNFRILRNHNNNRGKIIKHIESYQEMIKNLQTLGMKEDDSKTLKENIKELIVIQEEHRKNMTNYQKLLLENNITG